MLLNFKLLLSPSLLFGFFFFLVKIVAYSRFVKIRDTCTERKCNHCRCNNAWGSKPPQCHSNDQSSAIDKACLPKKTERLLALFLGFTIVRGRIFLRTRLKKGK